MDASKFSLNASAFYLNTFFRTFSRSTGKNMIFRKILGSNTQMELGQNMVLTLGLK